MTKKIGFIGLGCDKNRVDLEKMMFKLQSSDFMLVEDLSEANIILINTCAFIASARKEAIDTILEVVSSKGKENLEKIVVTGCLPERYSEELLKEIPEVDAYVKLKDNTKIDEIICGLYEIKPNKIKKSQQSNRVLSNSNHYAFLKIADGCNNCCSYCTIPRIRGRFTSTPMEDLINEAKFLAKLGVKELILVAQDTTRYGTDIYGEPKLVELIEKLSVIKEIERIRIHYCYPEMIDDKLLKLFETNDKLCGYLDIPFQHVNDEILKAMNRRSNNEQITTLVNKIHSLKRKIAIRSTFIIGYPGETRKQFLQLCDFLRKYKLDNVGFFAYSREEKTSAAYQKHHLPEFVKKRRVKYIQKIQNKVAKQNAIEKMGQIHSVIIDRFDQTDGCYYGRDEFNSVDVDYEIQIDNSSMEIGKFYNAKITDFKNNVYKGEIL